MKIVRAFSLLFFLLLTTTSTLRAQPETQSLPREKRVLTHALAFSPDGKTLAVGLTGIQGAKTGQRLVEIWDIASAKRLQTIETKDEQNDYLLFSPDSKRLATVGLLLGGVGAEAAVWDVATGKMLCQLVRDKPTTTVWGLAFSRDGKQLAGSMNSLEEGARHNNIRIWNAATGEVEREFRNLSMLPTATSFADDDKVVLASAWKREQGKVICEFLVLDVQSGKITRSLPLGSNPTFAFSLAPDGENVALPFQSLEPGGMRDWHLELRNWRNATPALALELPPIDAVVPQFTPDSKQLLAAGRLTGQPRRSELWRWDAQTGERLATIPLGNYEAQSAFVAAFSTDAKLLAMPGSQGKLQLFDTRACYALLSVQNMLLA
jgi:WD40 repeat protein